MNMFSSGQGLLGSFIFIREGIRVTTGVAFSSKYRDEFLGGNVLPGCDRWVRCLIIMDNIFLYEYDVAEIVGGVGRDDKHRRADKSEEDGAVRRLPDAALAVDENPLQVLLLQNVPHRPLHHSSSNLSIFGLWT